MGGHQSRFEEVDGEYLARPSTRLKSQVSIHRSKRKTKQSAERALDALTIENNARKAAKALRAGKLKVRFHGGIIAELTKSQPFFKAFQTALHDHQSNSIGSHRNKHSGSEPASLRFVRWYARLADGLCELPVSVIDNLRLIHN
jgi:hypothetical protein